MNDCITLPEKRCTKCGEYFPTTTEYFARDKQHRDGLRSRCKSCENEYCRKYRETNRERIREYGRNYHAKHRARDRDNYRRWCKENPERVSEYRHRSREYHRLYREANRERIRERDREYYIAHKAQRHVIKHNRKARKHGLPSDFTTEQQRFALDYFHHACAYCGRQFHDLFNERTLAFDHFIPLSSPECPGTTVTNMLPSCHGIDGCNTTKNSIPPHEWLIRRFGKRKSREIIARIEAYFDVVRERFP